MVQRPAPARSASHETHWLVDRSVLGNSWTVKACDEGLVSDIAERCDVDPLLARILAARGITSDGAPSFLNPTLRDMMPDPVVLTDMEKAVKRLALAIEKKETIGIFGDYDVDGVTATSLVALYLRELEASVEVYLPDRVADGYGPSIAAFDDLAARGASVIVTVDCGASAHEPVEAAAQKGLDIVVIDHHLMSGPPPEGAAAVINPNRADDVSGLTNLSAVGVAFMVLVGLSRHLGEAEFFKDRQRPDLRNWLDIVSLGLVCDVMPVTGLTRAMIAQGLKVLSRQVKTGSGGNAGLAALGKAAGVKLPATPYHLGFLLGPRINAAGRIGHANLAFELLTTRDEKKRARLSEKLHAMNADRQQIELDVLNAATAQIEQLAKKGPLPPVIIAAGEGWHPGVVGIVAGRLRERFNRPALALEITMDGAGNAIAKGSGRSMSGVDLGSAISKAREDGLLISGGGHAMAAGLSLAGDQLAALQSYLNEELRADVDEALAGQTVELDGVLSAQAVSGTTATLIAKAGPFGVGNPEPKFILEDMQVRYPKVVGESHLSCVLTSPTGEEVRAIAFRVVGEPLGEALMTGERLNVAGRIKLDDWRGGNAAQFHIADVAIPQS